MSCNICYLPFNRTNQLPKVILCCSRSICLSCCQKLDREKTDFCPYCKSKIHIKFAKLNNNRDFIDSLPEWTASKCTDHDKLNSMICETCEKEICTKCIQNHTSSGHSIVDIEDFLSEMENQQKDYKLWMNRAKEKCSIYEKMIQLRKDMLKSAVKKKFEETVVMLQTYQEQAMSAIDEKFKYLDVKSWFSEDIKQVIGECHEVFEGTSQRNLLRIFNFCQLKRLPVLKKWSEKDELESMKKYLSRVDFEFVADIAKPFRLINKEQNEKESEKDEKMGIEETINPTETL